MYNINNTAITQHTLPPLFVNLAQRLFKDPTSNAPFFDPDSSGYFRCGKDGELIDGTPVVDI
jgi:hypothetical protein